MTEETKPTLVENFNSLTAGEAEDIEDVLDLGIDHIGAIIDSDRPKMKIMRAVMWAVRRRTEPELEFEAMRDLSLEDLMEAPSPKASDGSSDDQPETTSGPPSSEPSDGSNPASS